MAIMDLIATGIRSIGASFPVAGSITNAWNEFESKKTNERVSELFTALAESIKQNEQKFEELKDEISKNQYVPQFFELITRNVIIEASEFKRKAYASLLTYSILERSTTDLEKLSLIQSIDSLNEIDLKVLSWFQNSSPVKVESQVHRMIGRNIDEKFSNLICVLSKLESRGLISESSSEESMSVESWVGDRNSWRNKWRLKYYIILPIGLKLFNATKPVG